MLNEERLHLILKSKFCPECGEEVKEKQWSQELEGNFKARCQKCRTELLISVVDFVKHEIKKSYLIN